MTTPQATTNLKVCTAEYMISDANGLGVARTWLPNIVAEQRLESTKDGKITIAPDPVPMIDGDLSWFNNSDDRQRVVVLVHRAPRVIIAQSPSTVVIHDAWAHQVGPNPTAGYPSVRADTFGGKLQIDRQSVARDALQFARWYLEGDDSQTYVDLGIVPPYQSFHFRYIASLQTPGTWTVPSEFEPRWEAFAYWANLLAIASPVGEL